MGESLFADFLYVFSSGMIFKIISAVIILILARTLSMSEFGMYTLIVSVILLTSELMDLEIPTAIVRYTSLCDKNTVKLLIRISLLVIFVTIVIMCVFSEKIAEILFKSCKYSRLVIIISICAALMLLCKICWNIVVGASAYKELPALKAVENLSRLIFIVPLAYFWGVNGVAVGILLAYATTLAFSGYIALRCWKRVKHMRDERRGLTRYLLSLNLTTLGRNALGWINTIVIAQKLSYVLIAIYKVALSIHDTILFIFGFETLFAPKFSKKDKKSIVNRAPGYVAFTVAVSIVVVLFCLFTPAPELLVSIVFGKRYMAAAQLFRLLLPALLINLSNIYPYTFKYYGRADISGAIVLSSLAIDVIVLYSLIDKLGIAAVAFSSFIAAAYNIIISHLLFNIFFSRHRRRQVL